MTLRTKGEQKAYIDGYERCAMCIKKYLSDEGKKQLECLLIAVRNAVEIEDIKPQPCDDCISRQEAINCVTLNEFRYKIVEDIKTLPSVTPKEKTGKWKKVYAETDYHNGWIEFSCENCEYQHGLESGQYEWSYGDPIPWKYCPICGAKMVEPQEREADNG